MTPRAVVLAAVGVALLVAGAGPRAQNAPWPAPSPAVRAGFSRFAGIYRLIGDGAPQLSGAPSQGVQRAPRGYLAYDPDGFMSVAIEWPGRARFAAGRPTPQEARRALDGFTAYWGTFAVHAEAGTITHQTFGALQPAISGTDRTYRFTTSGPRLTLRGPAVDGARALTWERVPDVSTPTALQRQLTGFWRLVSTEQRTTRGELVRAYPGWTGFIVYAPSGHMLVHMSEPYRRRPVGGVPTPEEALAAYANYTSYFGTYTIDPSGRSVTHHVEGSVNPGSAGTDTQRFFEISGRQLILRPPPIRTPAGEVVMTNVWERLRE